MRPIILALAAVCLGLFARPGLPAHVDTLYQATVDLRDLEPSAGSRTGEDPKAADKPRFQSEEARRRALMEAALGQVLVRLAGTSQVVADPVVQRRVIGRAQSFVQRFQYLERGGEHGPRMRVHFTESAVRDALWETGWPVWGRFRPGILVWVAYRGDGGLQLASPDSHPRVFDALRQEAHRDGLPLLFPLLDGRDRDRLTAKDLLFEDWTTIRSASRRYDPDGVLLLRLDGKGGGFKAKWALRAGEAPEVFGTEGKGLQAAVAEGLDGVLVRLSRRYTVYPGPGTDLEIEVGELGGLDHFARVERGLAGLAAVEAVTPIRVDGDRARYRLSFRGQPEEASHVLRLLDFLSPRSEEGSDDDPDAAPLRFTFRP